MSEITAIRIPEEKLAAFEAQAKRYPNRQAMVLPALWMIQDEFGWISPEAMEYVAELTGTTPSHVYGVVSFYHMYFDKPPGKYVIEVCQTTSCSLLDCEKTLDYLHKKLGVGLEEPTADGKFMIRRVECLGACEHAPVSQINHRFVFKATPEKIQAEMDELE